MNVKSTLREREKNVQFRKKNLKSCISTIHVHLNIFYILNIHGSLHCNNILIYKYQQDAHVAEFIISDSCSKCFGRHYHPSLGGQNNCNYSI